MTTAYPHVFTSLCHPTFDEEPCVDLLDLDRELVGDVLPLVVSANSSQFVLQKLPTPPTLA